MLVKMRRDATRDEVAAVEDKLHTLGFKTGKMVGEEITLVGVYGDISTLPVGEIEELPGVEQLIPISRAYKRAAQKGAPDRPIYQTVRIGDVVCGATSWSSSRARVRSRARRRSRRPPAW